MTRNEIIRSLARSDGLGLEVGPSFSPIFPKREGFAVEVLDHAPADELRKKYAPFSVDIDNIETVDYVSDGRPMHEIIAHRGYYDYIVASHVIEHTPDFVGFFKSCEFLLKEDGAVILAVPDKRYCFDVMQHPTSTGEVLHAYHDKHCRHAPARIFDFCANIGRFDDADTWGAEKSRGTLQLIGSLEHAVRMFNLSFVDETYLDIHAWRFTPSSFRLLISDLNNIGTINLREKSFYCNGSFEFVTSLSRDGTNCEMSRLDLIKEICREQAVGLAQVLA